MCSGLAHDPHEKLSRISIQCKMSQDRFFAIAFFWNVRLTVCISKESDRKKSIAQHLMPHLTQSRSRNIAYACSVHMYQCISELWLYNSSNFALHYNCYKVSFKTLHYMYLTQRWMTITVSVLQKNLDAKQPKNVKFSLWSIIETIPRGGARLFRGGAKILRGGACKTISGGGAHLHTPPSEWWIQP
jgi:hypothetical protein